MARPAIWQCAAFFVPLVGCKGSAIAARLETDEPPANAALQQPTRDLPTDASGEGVTGQPSPTVTETVRTVAGSLQILELEPMSRYEVRLGDKSILTTNMGDDHDPFRNGPYPRVLKKITPPTIPFDEVILFEQSGGGNACGFYGLWFLGLKNNGTVAVSKPLPACGGPQPRVTATPQRVTVFFPAAPPNRGTGIVPSETWVYEKGDVKKRP